MVEREMGEDMVDRAGLAPVGLGRRASSVGKRQHAAEQALGRAADEQDLAVMLEPVGDALRAAAGPPWRALTG